MTSKNAVRRYREFESLSLIQNQIFKLEACSSNPVTQPASLDFGEYSFAVKKGPWTLCSGEIAPYAHCRKKAPNQPS